MLYNPHYVAFWSSSKPFYLKPLDPSCHSTCRYETGLVIVFLYASYFAVSFSSDFYLHRPFKRRRRWYDKQIYKRLTCCHWVFKIVLGVKFIHLDTIKGMTCRCGTFGKGKWLAGGRLNAQRTTHKVISFVLTCSVRLSIFVPPCGIKLTMALCTLMFAPFSGNSGTSIRHCDSVLLWPGKSRLKRKHEAVSVAKIYWQLHFQSLTASAISHLPTC